MRNPFKWILDMIGWPWIRPNIAFPPGYTLWHADHFFGSPPGVVTASDSSWDRLEHTLKAYADRKNSKLVALARYIEQCRALVDVKKAQKKKHSHILKAIRDAQHERMEIEMGIRVWDGLSWVKR